MIAPQRRWIAVEAPEPSEDIHWMPAWESYHVTTHRCRCCPVISEENRETGIRVYKHHARDDAN